MAAADLRARIASTLAAGGYETVSLDETAGAEYDLLLLHTPLTAEAELPALAPGRRPLVVCAPQTGPRAVRKALERGLDGLIWETQVESRLVPTVVAVAAGQLALPREVWRPSEEQELTNREKQTLALVVMGLSNGEIASKLYVSESTVKSHLSSAFRKLGVRSRAEAARVIADPRGGLGTGILAITPTSSSGRASNGS